MKAFQSGRKDLRFNGSIPERIDAYIGYYLTAGRRRSFFCDHRSVKLCLTCHLIRDYFKRYNKKSDLSLSLIEGVYNKKPYSQVWILYYRQIERNIKNNFKETFRRIPKELLKTKIRNDVKPNT